MEGSLISVFPETSSSTEGVGKKFRLSSTTNDILAYAALIHHAPAKIDAHTEHVCHVYKIRRRRLKLDAVGPREGRRRH